MTDEPKGGRFILAGDSICGGDGDLFVVRYDDKNKPNYFEINGEEVTELEYRVRRGGQFP